MTDWVILRTRGSSTLRLARSLTDAGLESWTPIEIQMRRHGKARERQETIVAVMPTYVFARALHMMALFELADGPSLHPDFSVFRCYNRIPLVDDRELYRLRQIERRAAAKAEPVVFTKGQEVQIPDGPYQGLTGQVVEDTKGKYTLIAFPGVRGFRIPIKFATWTLSVAA